MAPRWFDRRREEPWPPVPRPVSAEAAAELLASGRVVSYELIPWGSNYTYLAALSHGDEPEALAVYKPRRGEAPLWDFPDGTLYRRERAAYLAAEALGWHFIPLTIIRDGPEGIGSMQLFVETEGNSHRPQLTEEHRDQLACVALFDLIANNADRKAGHCLVGQDGRVWGIDHGLTFHTHPKLRTVLWEFYRGSVAPELLAAVRKFLNTPARCTALRAQLEELLEREEVHAFFARAERVVDSGRYPSLDNYRSRPWPFF